MTAALRYYLSLTIHGQRYLAPLLLYLTALTVFTVNDTGPLIGSYVVSAGSLLLTMCWLTVTVINGEDPTRRAVTVVTAGGPGRVLAALIGLALLAGIALIAVGTVFPIVSGSHSVSFRAVAVGALAQGVTTFVGVGVGAVCSRMVVPRAGYSLVLALVVVIAVPLTPGLPPVNPMLRLMSAGEASVGQLSVYLAVAVLMLGAAVTATHHIAVRRD